MLKKYVYECMKETGARRRLTIQITKRNLLECGNDFIQAKQEDNHTNKKITHAIHVLETSNFFFFLIISS